MIISNDDVVVNEATGNVWIIHAISADTGAGDPDPDVVLHHADRRQSERDTVSSMQVLRESITAGELRLAKFPQTVTAVYTRNDKVVVSVSGPIAMLADIQLVAATQFAEYCKREAAAGRTVRHHETDQYLKLQPNKYGLEHVETNHETT